MVPGSFSCGYRLVSSFGHLFLLQGGKEGVEFGTKSIAMTLLSMPIVGSDGHNLPRQPTVNGTVADASRAT